MKKIKFSSIEVLGIVGLVLWNVVNLLREIQPSGNAAYLFWLGVLPNLGAAWGMTMFGKWALILLAKQNYTLKTHALLCAGIAALALGSEVVHDLFLNSAFDFYDIMVTGIAQLLMFFVPVIRKDKFLSAFEASRNGEGEPPAKP